MEQNPPEEVRFMTNVLDLTDLIHELATICWDAGRKDVNPTLIAVAENFLESYDPNVLIDIFIRHSYMHWHKIHDRDEDFFISNAHVIFKQLPVDTSNINAFRVFFEAKTADGEYIIVKEDRDAIWNIFDSLVKICIKYIHKVRDAKLVKTAEGIRPAYQNKKYPEIKVREQAKMWGIDLPIPGKD
jgi:hypothetical protein